MKGSQLLPKCLGKHVNFPANVNELQSGHKLVLIHTHIQPSSPCLLCYLVHLHVLRFPQCSHNYMTWFCIIEGFTNMYTPHITHNHMFSTQEEGTCGFLHTHKANGCNSIMFQLSATQTVASPPLLLSFYYTSLVLCPSVEIGSDQMPQSDICMGQVCYPTKCHLLSVVRGHVLFNIER